MRLGLVPVGHRGDVVGQWLEFSLVHRGPPAQSLDGNAEFFFEADRVEYVPAIHGVLGYLFFLFLPERIAEKGRRIGVLEAPGAAEIVFGAGSANGGIFPVAVDEEFYFTFAPPAIGELGPGEEGAGVVTLAADTFNDDIIGIGTVGDSTTPLGVEIAGGLGNVGERVVDLVKEKADLFCQIVFDGDPATLVERHGPIAVHGTGGVDGDGHGIDVVGQAVAKCEKIAQRHFNGGHLLAVPVKTQNAAPQIAFVRGHPDVLDDAGPFDFSQGVRGAGLDFDAGADLPALAQFAGPIIRARLSLGAAAGRAGGVLRRNRAGLRAAK